MAKKTALSGKWIALLTLFFGLIGLVVYLVIKPYFGWTSHTIDNFISISYPSNWQTVPYNFTELYGEEHLFLASNYKGKLSFGDSSSSEEIFRLEASRRPKSKVKSLDDYIKPFLNFCDGGECIMKKLQFEKNGTKMIMLSINASGIWFFQGERYLFIEGKDYFYDIHGGYFSGPGTLSDFLRQRILDKIFNSVEIKTK